MKRYIDLTHLIEEGMPVFPGDPRPEIREPMGLGDDGCSVQTIRFGNHLGTHIDAPSHFIKDGMTIHEIPLETLIGKAMILDFTDKKKNDVIGRGDLQRHLDSIEAGARVLLTTGWDRYFLPEIFYEGFPCLTLEAAQYLATKKIRLLGMDTPSPSPVNDPGQLIHKTLLGAGIVLLEAVRNLTLIDRDECDLIVLPPPFKNFSGSPCRAVAVIES